MRIKFPWLIATSLLGGCVSGGVSIDYPDGRHVEATYGRLGGTKFDGLKITDGDRAVEVTGYQSEGAGLVEAAARGAVQGAGKAANPLPVLIR